MLAFIGSEAAAHAILAQHPTPETLHKVLGLGAKNAAVVLPGADLEDVADRLVGGALGFNGQRCTAEKIVYVPRADADRLADRLARRVGQLAIAMPWSERVDITPLPEPGKPRFLAELVRDAVAHGAAIANPGGGESCGGLVRPAVLAGVISSMRVFHEEQFGPIVPVAAYDDVGEIVEWQRQSPYGQQVGIWGPTAAARPLIRALASQVARVNLDDVCQRGPDSFGFTATDKSGFGVLSLRDALLTFSRPVLIQSRDPGQLASIP
jgi:glyceraldehyde-3-phosphate dehydrogenase (NADP+)